MGEFNARDYWEDRLKEGLDLHRVGYLGLGRYYNDWLYKIRRKVFDLRMKSLGLDFRVLNVLDIGSGTGFYIDRWKELGVETVIGTDITDISVEELKRKYPAGEFYQVDIGGDIEDIGKRRFDIVSAFDVLFHIIDDERHSNAIDNIHSILNPGGLFVFSDNFLHGEAIRSEYQVSRSLNEIERILNDAGFEIMGRYPMFVLMNYPIDSESRALKKLWQVMTKVVSINEKIGWLAGMMLYPLELICISLMKESPTTEMMICRKSD